MYALMDACVFSSGVLDQEMILENEPKHFINLPHKKKKISSPDAQESLRAVPPPNAVKQSSACTVTVC